jgi:FixJ family two-component response regulator
MPEMNGDQLAAVLRELNPQQRIILLTGFGDSISDFGERPDNVDLVVSKPFTLNVLREAIAKGVRNS